MLEVSLKSLQLLLGAGAIALGASAVSFPSSTGRAVESAPLDFAPAPGVSRTLARYAVISERNLFRPRLVADPPPPPELKESKLDIELRGTLIVGSRPAKLRARKPRSKPAPLRRSAPPVSLAIVRDVDGAVHSLAVGDELAEKRARLIRIEPRRIVIEHESRLEVVTLYDDGKGGSAGSSGSIPATVPPRATAFGLLERLLPGGSVESDPDLGIQTYRVAGNGGALGLHEDDRIRALNGIPLEGDDIDSRLTTLLAMRAELILSVEDASGRARLVPVPAASLDRLLRGAR